MAIEESSAETESGSDESAAASEGNHPIVGWIISAVFFLATLYMVFMEPFPTMAAEWFYAVIFGLATVVAAGYALREHGILTL